MQVKIGDKIYRDNDHPVGVFLTAQDRINILAMDPDKNFYCAFPKDTSEGDVRKFMTMPKPAAPAKPEAAPLKPAGE